MRALEESDRAIVSMNQPNKEERSSTEVGEKRARTKENIIPPNTNPTQSGEHVSQGLNGVREAAKERRQERFTALLHHRNVDLLRKSYYALKRQAAPGMDGVTWKEYETGLEDRLIDLHSRVHRGAYRAQPSRRVYIPKADGRQRPLGIAALEDKIVQQAVVTIVLDLWFERVVQPRLRGEAYLVRYIDDFVLCFQYRADALRVQEVLRKRLGKFSLTLAEAKTKLVEFGRFAQRYANKRGRRRPETIYFLGFTLYCTRNQKGNFRVGLRTEKARLRRALMRLQDQMRRMRHEPIPEQVQHLNQMLRGHYAYYGIAGNFRALQRVHRAVERYWRRRLSSRSWKGTIWWKYFHQIKDRTPLLRPTLYLPYVELQAIAVL